jgi:hypothetical protein
MAELVVNADTGAHEALLNSRFQPFSRFIFIKIRFT